MWPLPRFIQVRDSSMKKAVDHTFGLEWLVTGVAWISIRLVKTQLICYVIWDISEIFIYTYGYTYGIWYECFIAQKMSQLLSKYMWRETIPLEADVSKHFWMYKHVSTKDIYCISYIPELTLGNKFQCVRWLSASYFCEAWLVGVLVDLARGVQIAKAIVKKNMKNCSSI